MDREGYQKRIDDMLNAVSSLLDANNANVRAETIG